MNVETVVVAVDFSPASAAAARQARRLVGTRGTLRLLHVVDDGVLAASRIHGDPAALLPLRGRLAEEWRARLERFVLREGDDGGAVGPTIELEIAFGNAVDEILACCERTSAGLVAVGAHARSVLGRLVHDGVADAVARRSRIPTLVVREDPACRPERVLVAIDYGPCSIDALRTADSLARRLGASLEAVHVIEPESLILDALGPVGLPLPAEGNDESLHLLRTFVAATLGREDASVRLIRSDPSRELSRCATSRDILVCGTHGRGFLAGIIAGSLAARVVGRSSCPVVVVSPELASEPARS